ncbi:hypothetical protein BD779DRAFT_1470955 [Infundibulicybe gibba]|nr:hypothetical protein BD779DRAFT_1470955 [Infundibulicybe gibba]
MAQFDPAQNPAIHSITSRAMTLIDTTPESRRLFHRRQVQEIINYEYLLRSGRQTDKVMPAGFMEFAAMWNESPTVSADLCLSRWDSQGELIPGTGTFNVTQMMGIDTITGQMIDFVETDPSYAKAVVNVDNRGNILDMIIALAVSAINNGNSIGNKRKRTTVDGYQPRPEERADRPRNDQSKNLGPKKKPVGAGGNKPRTDFGNSRPRAEPGSKARAEPANARASSSKVPANAEAAGMEE